MGKRRLCRRLTYQAIISLQFNSGYCPCENVYGLLGLFGAIPDKSAPPPLMLLATALCANSFPLASRPDIRTARSTCVQSSWRHFDHDRDENTVCRAIRI